jgi:hypothetical protein
MKSSKMVVKWVLAFLLANSIPTLLVSAQSTAGQNPQDPRLHSRSENPSSRLGRDQVVCPKYPDHDWPIHETIIATNPMPLDAGDLKPGTEIYANVMYPLKYADCALDDNAVLYGHVTSSISSKEINKYELSVVFDHADCKGRSHAEIPLRLIAMVAPRDEVVTKLRDVLPRPIRGQGQTSAATDDNAVEPDYLPSPVHPGLVSRMPNIRLQPDGGPQCSARISDPDHTVELVKGTALIFTRLMLVKK